MTPATEPVGFRDDMTIAEARALLRDLALADGHACPVCTQLAKVYKRKLHASMAAGLVRFYRFCGTEPGYVPAVLPSDRLSADFPKLRYWGLIAQIPGERGDGSDRVGWWRITPEGVAFIEGVKVRSHAKVFNGRCLGLAGDPVSIHDCLGSAFDFTELMAEPAGESTPEVADGQAHLRHAAPGAGVTGA